MVARTAMAMIAACGRLDFEELPLDSTDPEFAVELDPAPDGTVPEPVLEPLPVTWPAFAPLVPEAAPIAVAVPVT